MPGIGHSLGFRRSGEFEGNAGRRLAARACQNGVQLNTVEQTAGEVAEKYPEQVRRDPWPLPPSRNTGQHRRSEAAGDQFKPQQDDHDKTDGKDHRSHQRHAGLPRCCEREACRHAKQRAGKNAPDQQVLDR